MTRTNLIINIGQPQLLPVFRQSILISASQNPGDNFIVLSDQPMGYVSSFKNICWIHMDPEIYREGLRSEHIEVRKMINRLESQDFSRTFCVEGVQWGRWIIDCAGSNDVLVLRDYGPVRKAMTYRKMLESLGGEEVYASSSRQICHTWEELFLNSLKSCQCLLVLEDSDKDLSREIFSEFQNLLVVPAGTLCSNRTKKLVELWSKGQLLSTYSPISEWKFAFHYVVRKVDESLVRSLSDTFHEFRQVKSIVNEYVQRSKECRGSESKTNSRNQNILESDLLDDSACGAGLRRAKPILASMMNNLKSGVHLFSGIQTQFFSYLIADHIFSGVCPSRITFFDKEAVLAELGKFKGFLDSYHESPAMVSFGGL